MGLVRKTLDLFRVDTSNHELVRAQMRVLARQIPMLYLILMANTAFLSATHHKIAPLWLSVLMPLGFSALAVGRIVSWWNLRNGQFSIEVAARRLRSVVILAGILGLAISTWGMSLYPYGDSFARAHVVVYLSLTLVACVFCLMHLRAAAFTLVLVVTVPGMVFVYFQNHSVLGAIEANLVLVTAVMLFILSTNHRDFFTMVMQKQHLEKVNRETRRLNEENHKLANHDSLTGLPNRRSFIAEIEARVAAEPSEGFALGVVDLDGFKAVNDLYGHATGDALLVEASHRMSTIREDGTMFARLGGDEFGIIVRKGLDLAAFGRTLCEVLRQPYELDDVTAVVTSSCGLVEFAEGCRSTKELFEYADYALYQAKSKAGGNTVIFSSSHRDELRRGHEIDQTLRNADLTREMALVYQPVINTKTGQLVAFEALARWRSRTLGTVGPMQFIAAAEKSSLINRVTLLLLAKLLRDLSEWPSDVSASFNLSARSLASPAVMLQILKMIRQSPVDPKRIEFEVTETALMIDFDASQRALGMLRNLGCSVALDDFGTGYSSLSHVHMLPLDKIKIDRKFIGDMTQNAKAASVVKTVIDLCENLGLACVAEGVETPAQSEALAAQGCLLAQGYLYGKPMPARDVASMLSNRTTPGILRA